MPIPLLHTIGHSNRELTDFLALLTSEQIQTLADVRRFPGSRRYPQFNRETLSKALADAGIAYAHFPALGGRRTARSKTSQNSAWRIAACAAYADYMQTDEFKTAFDQLTVLATQSRTAIMCAEALPWRCHRRLIADQFIAARWQVHDIIGPNNTEPHELPDFAVITAGHVTYPGVPRPLFDN